MCSISVFILIAKNHLTCQYQFNFFPMGLKSISRVDIFHKSSIARKSVWKGEKLSFSTHDSINWMEVGAFKRKHFNGKWWLEHFPMHLISVGKKSQQFKFVGVVCRKQNGINQTRKKNCIKINKIIRLNEHRPYSHITAVAPTMWENFHCADVI